MEAANASLQLDTGLGLCKYENDIGHAIHIMGDQHLFLRTI